MQSCTQWCDLSHSWCSFVSLTTGSSWSVLCSCTPRCRQTLPQWESLCYSGPEDRGTFKVSLQQTKRKENRVNWSSSSSSPSQEKQRNTQPGLSLFACLDLPSGHSSVNISTDIVLFPSKLCSFTQRLHVMKCAWISALRCSVALSKCLTTRFKLFSLLRNILPKILVCLDCYKTALSNSSNSKTPQVPFSLHISSRCSLFNRIPYIICQHG